MFEDTGVKIEAIRSFRWLAIVFLVLVFLLYLIFSGLITKLVVGVGNTQIAAEMQNTTPPDPLVRERSPELTRLFIEKIQNDPSGLANDVVFFLQVNQWKYNYMREFNVVQICAGLEAIKKRGLRCSGERMAATELVITYLYEGYLVERSTYASEKGITRYNLSRIGRDVAEVYRLEMLKTGKPPSYFKSYDISELGIVDRLKELK